MSAEAVGWVYRHSPYKGAAFAIHLAIADVVNDFHGNEVWASQAMIGDKARVRRQGVSEHMGTLASDGFITLLEDNARAGKPNRYRFEYPMVPVVWGVSAERTPGVRIGDTQGVRSADTERGPSEPKSTDTYSTAFEDAWAAYPRKIAKKAAWKAWKATLTRIGSTPTSKSRLITAAKNYAIAVKGRNEEHMLHAATFYGPSERWTDFENGVPITTNGHAAVRSAGKLGSREDDL